MTVPTTFHAKVREELKSHIMGACNLAEEGFISGKGGEDAVTGALGERLRLKEKLVAVEGAGTWRILITWNKFRSAKGKSGEEREIGADGIIQFEMFGDYGSDVYTKAMLFQSKMEHDQAHRRLRGQCENMELIAKDCSAVIRYGENGYFAMNGSEVLQSFERNLDTTQALWRRAMPLGEYITEHFLNCKVGHENLYYEHKSETLFVPTQTAYRRLRTKLNKISIEVYSPRHQKK